ncbi:MAG: hypothetical protein WBM24_08565 [Candidatus Sulfotelmatobacter sp.]
MNQDQLNTMGLISHLDLDEVDRLNKARIQQKAANKTPPTPFEQASIDIENKRAEVKQLAHQSICLDTPRVYESRINDLSNTIKFQNQRLEILLEVLIPSDFENYDAYVSKRDDRNGMRPHPNHIGPFNGAIRNLESWTDSLATSQKEMVRLRKLYDAAKVQADDFRKNGEKRLKQLRRELALYDLRQRIASGATHLLQSFDRAVLNEEPILDLPYRPGSRKKD